MEIKTCEEYVLSELKRLTYRNEELENTLRIERAERESASLSAPVEYCPHCGRKVQ